MKVKVNDATLIQLNWMVAKCDIKRAVLHDDGITRCIMLETAKGLYAGRFNPSTDWAQGGPIIEREGIKIHKGNDLYFPKGNEKSDYYEPLWVAGKQHGQTPLIAAMRCYVASKLGDTVELPQDLIN